MKPVSWAEPFDGNKKSSCRTHQNLNIVKATLLSISRKLSAQARSHINVARLCSFNDIPVISFIDCAVKQTLKGLTAG